MKVLIGIVVIVFLGFIFFSGGGEKSEQMIFNETESEMMEEAKMSAVDSDSVYEVVPGESSVTWSGKKPLVDGYINTGSLSVSGGNIDVVKGKVSGEFILDMDSLEATETKAKPGKESFLSEHLKGDRWFDVATHPTATFVIKEAVPKMTEGDETYDVTGDLTLKGQTHEISFPAEVFVNENGKLMARASFEFDRTRWGITTSSGSFFDDLADNMVDDMVALSFVLVAESK